MKFSYSSGAKPLQGFTIKRGIGVGGFGEVYFAISDAGKEVALKKIQRNLDIELRGVRQCLNLNHVNLISLWDIKTNAYGESWVVMEYVPGVSLRDVIEAFPGGMPESEIKKWFAATASGVAYLHKHGIVHRDLKPGNIFRDDDQHIVKIGDYGLSKFIACNRRSGHTESVGTFHYMAPEIGNGVYGKEIDIYALGILLFEMLTGDVPFDGESSQEIIMKHLTANVSLEKIPPAFHRVTLKALNKDPQHRYRSVQAMVKELPWRDLASNSDSITARYAMGHPSLIRASEGQSKSTVGSGKAKIAPIFISGESLEILKEDYVFGESIDGPRSQHQPKASKTPGPPPTIRPNPAIHQSTAPHPADRSASLVGNQGVPVNSDVLQSTSNRLGTAGNPMVGDAEVPVSQRQTAVGRASEPRAVKVSSLSGESETRDRSGADGSVHAAVNANGVIQWWNQRSAATVAKLIVTMVAIGAISLASALLLKLAFVAGVFYLVSYLRRHKIINTAVLAQDSQQNGGLGGRLLAEHGRSKRRHLKTISTFGLTPAELTAARGGLAKSTWRIQLMDLIGSLLVAALSCFGLNLLPLALLTPWSASPSVEVLVDFWSRYAFAVSVSVFACWTMLVANTLWDFNRVQSLRRRGGMMGLGLMTAAAGGAAADYFDLPLATSPWNISTDGFSGFQVTGLPDVAAYSIFFIAMFGSLRWWYQVDRLRKTRLSLGTVGLSFVWAVMFSHIVDRSVFSHGLFGIVVSTSIQLAAPWVSAADRFKFVSRR